MLACLVRRALFVDAAQARVADRPLVERALTLLEPAPAVVVASMSARAAIAGAIARQMPPLVLA